MCRSLPGEVSFPISGSSVPSPVGLGSEALGVLVARCPRQLSLATAHMAVERRPLAEKRNEVGEFCLAPPPRAHPAGARETRGATVPPVPEERPTPSRAALRAQQAGLASRGCQARGDTGLFRWPRMSGAQEGREGNAGWGCRGGGGVGQDQGWHRAGVQVRREQLPQSSADGHSGRLPKVS